MSYGIALVVMTLVAQVAEQPKSDLGSVKELDAARQLLRSGRYAEAEEAYTAAEAEAKKQAGRGPACSSSRSNWVKSSARPARGSIQGDQGPRGAGRRSSPRTPTWRPGWPS